MAFKDEKADFEKEVCFFVYILGKLYKILCFLNVFKLKRLYIYRMCSCFVKGASLALLHQGLLHLHHNSAFHSLSEKLTAIFIGTGNISGGVVGIGGTTSGAI